MKFEQNQHVKCVFKNGTVVEGVVESWSKEEAILTSLDGESVLIIPRPDDDIMLIKLVLKSAAPKEKTKPESPKTELEQKFNDVLAQPSDTPGRVETLAELRIQLAEEEKQIIANKLKEHHIGTPRVTSYKNPWGGGVSAYDLGAAARMRQRMKK